MINHYLLYLRVVIHKYTSSSELPHNIRIIYYLVLTCKDLINNVAILESIYSSF